MSSLAAARADNFYHPPDWDPRKKSRGEHAAKVTRKEDKWRGHPLRERAKKLATEGILTIRFEMPFNVRCTGCENHIAKGVRFNAEKSTIGKYLSTNIYSFRMMCHCEDGTSRTDRRKNPHWIEIHTDPKNAEYLVVEGAVRISEPKLATAEELGVETAIDSEEAQKRAANPFYRLEKAGSAVARKPWLARLQEERDADWEDDYDANAALRRIHRSKRKAALLQSAAHESMGIRVPLGEGEHPEDDAAAQASLLHGVKRKSVMQRAESRHKLLGGSIFGSANRAQEDARLALQRRKRERGMSFSAPPTRTGAHAPPRPPISHLDDPLRIAKVQVRPDGNMHGSLPPRSTRSARDEPCSSASRLVAYSDSSASGSGEED